MDDENNSNLINTIKFKPNSYIPEDTLVQHFPLPGGQGIMNTPAEIMHQDLEEELPE